MEYLLLFIGFGFFLYVIHLVERDEERRYHRRVNEQREFGFLFKKEK